MIVSHASGGLGARDGYLAKLLAAWGQEIDFSHAVSQRARARAIDFLATGSPRGNAASATCFAVGTPVPSRPAVPYDGRDGFGLRIARSIRCSVKSR